METRDPHLLHDPLEGSGKGVTFTVAEAQSSIRSTAEGAHAVIDVIVSQVSDNVEFFIEIIKTLRLFFKRSDRLFCLLAEDLIAVHIKDIVKTDLNDCPVTAELSIAVSDLK